MASILSWKDRLGLLSHLLAAILVLTQLAALFLGIKFLLPNIWARQVADGFFWNFATFILVALASSFGEWWFHRDIQHNCIFSYLRYAYNRHGLHHGLTIIAVEKPGVRHMTIMSKYPMISYKQHQSVFFPAHMFLATLAFYSVLLVLLQWIFPGVPFLLGGYSAVAAADICYEIFHPLEHRSEEWWDERKKNPIARILRRYISYLRRLHEYHHLNIKYDMAVAGFFGLPLADMVLGTYYMPPVALTDGTSVTREDISPPQVSRFVRWHDLWVQTRSRRLLEEFHAKLARKS